MRRNIGIFSLFFASMIFCGEKSGGKDFDKLSLEEQVQILNDLKCPDTKTNLNKQKKQDIKREVRKSTRLLLKKFVEEYNKRKK